jgi:hypothetical protein
MVDPVRGAAKLEGALQGQSPGHKVMMRPADQVGRKGGAWLIDFSVDWLEGVGGAQCSSAAAAWQSCCTHTALATCSCDSVQCVNELQQSRHLAALP